MADYIGDSWINGFGCRSNRLLDKKLFVYETDNINIKQKLLSTVSFTEDVHIIKRFMNE